jgi:hypothetical protein
MESPENVPKAKTLNSWKEIAACLGVTVRSVQRWEQTAGLPVHRMGTGARARVFAYSDELLSWRTSRGADPEAESPAPAARPRRGLVYSVAAGVAVLLTAAGVLALHIFDFDPEPAEWVFERSTLKVVNARGRVLWEKRFPASSRAFDSTPGDKALINDLDGDGRKEILFNYIPDNPAALGGSLMCFDRAGRLRWETRYGAPKTFGDRTFAQSYKGAFVRVVRVQGKPRVLTVANHYLWYPAQVALLDPGTGKVLSEYWHSGSINHCFVRDLDGDGADEVILGAINNPGSGLGHAGVAVLKLPLRELAYLLFPVPDVSRVMGVLPIIGHMAIDENRRIVLQTPFSEGGIVYYLDFGLRVVEARVSDGFAPLHNRMHRQGLLDHALTPRETEALGRVLRLPSTPNGNDPELDRFWTF